MSAGLEVVTLETRRLPFADVGVSLPLRLAMSAMQLPDLATGEAILLCIVCRRPCKFVTVIALVS
jgi:hypothetical protein